MTCIEAEVGILGGGPAGAVLARELAASGHDVLLIERADGPGPPRGESLPSSIIPLLASLGLLGLVDAATYKWEHESLIAWRRDDHGRRDNLARLIDRATLDPLLRTAARAAGARLLSPARALFAARTAAGCWGLRVRGSAGDQVLTVRLLVDARGRRRGPRAGLATLALIGRWQHEAFLETRIEAGGDHWLWGSPQPGGTYDAAVFLDAARLTSHTPEQRLALLRDALANSHLLTQLSTSTPLSVRVRDATACCSPDPIGHDYLRVGEAAVAIDPLSSQGLQASLRLAVQGAASLRTLLAPGGDHSAALDFYRDRQRALAEGTSAAGRRHYAAAERDAPFWKDRAHGAPAAPRLLPRATQPGAGERLAPAAGVRLAPVPAVVGALIARVPALSHRDWPEPVAYLGGIALAPLFAMIDGPLTSGEILARWARRLSPETAAGVLAWMCASQVIVPVSTCL